MTSATKSLKSKTSHLLFGTRTLSESFEGLNSSLAQSAGEFSICPNFPSAPFVGFYWKNKNLVFDP